MTGGIMNLKDCKRCNRMVRSRNNIVPYDGHEDPDIIFIGDAPGIKEDIEAKPFIGLSGNHLKKSIKEFGLDKYKIGFTNIVMCRPPNNSEPFPYEKLNCFQHLIVELKKKKPIIIVPLGNHAKDLFVTTKRKIVNIVGNAYVNEYKATGDTYVVIPNVHPRYDIMSYNDHTIYKQ